MSRTTKKTPFLLAILFSWLLPVLAAAQMSNGPIGGFSGPSYNFETLGLHIADALWIVFTVIAVIMFIVTGINFLTALGDSEKVATARRSFLWGVVGIVVAIVAYSIIALVRSALGA